MALGCGMSTAEIYDRGGLTRLFFVDRVNLVRYDRVRDDMSEATVIVPSSAECCGLLADLEPGRHELVIRRDGQRVWEGPVVRIGYGTNQIEITARDVMFYAYRTINRAGQNNAAPNTDWVTERARTIMNREMFRKESLDPPINVLRYLDVRTTQTTARTARVTKPYQKTVFEEVDDMAAKSGLDYTVVGRAVVMFDTHEPIGIIPAVSQSDFLGELVITSYGMDLATYSAVTNSEDIWGAWGGADPYYGEIEILATAFEEEGGDPSQIPGQQELISQAQRNLAGRYPTPVVARVPDSSALNPSSHAISFADLVPGVKMPLNVRSGCRTVNQEQKLDKVRVEQDADGERITVTLVPWPGSVPGTGESSGAIA